MTSLLVLQTIPALSPVPDVMRDFGSAKRPLRPSSLVRVGACPMSAVLNDDMVNDDGNGAAQTGNLIHAAAAAFHRAASSMTATARTEEGLAALEAARLKFPDGSYPKAVETFRAYAADPENIEADCPWVEQPIELRIQAAPNDPTGEPIVVIGTLDQVRRERNGRLRLWDIKTGSRLSGSESLTAYAVQQACYLLAARQVLADNVEPGGLIYTPGYEKKHGRRFFRYTLTVEECMLLVSVVAYNVALIRSGIPIFRPGVDTCEYCRYSKNGGKGFSDCLPEFRTSY